MRRARSQTISQSGRDSPTSGSACAHALHAAVAVGEGAVFLGKAGGGQDHVGVVRRFVEEDVMQTRKSSCSSACWAWARFGSLISGFSPRTTMPGPAPVRRRIDHFGDGQAGFGREAVCQPARSARGSSESVDRLVGGVDARAARRCPSSPGRCSGRAAGSVRYRACRCARSSARDWSATARYRCRACSG